MLPWKPLVRSRQISNPSKLSCMLSLPASMKRIRSRTAEKKWIHSFLIISLWGFFQTFNSAVSGPIRLKFKPVPALVHVIITCNYEKEWMKTAEKTWRHRFSHHNPICYHGNQCSDLAEFKTHPSSHVCYHYLQV